MSLDERIQQLDERIASRFKDWVQDLHEQLSQTLNNEIARQLEEATSQVPDSLMDPDRFESITSAASSVGGEVVMRNLHSAMVGIDRSGKQTEILQALIQGAGAFASRLAIFLTRADQASGWSSLGFGDGDAGIPGLVIEYQGEGPWQRLSEGRSSIRLSAADCGHLCSRIEAPLPRDGVLIPLVLRDRVAAALYADRLQDDPGGLGIEGLQLLAYGAAQAIENLPFRQRTSTTPTLVLTEEEEVEQEGLGLWGGAGSAAAAVAAVAVSQAVNEGSEAETEAEEKAAVEDVSDLEVGLEADSAVAVPSEPEAEVEVETEMEVEVEAEAEVEEYVASETLSEAAGSELPDYTDTQDIGLQLPEEEAPDEPSLVADTPTQAWDTPPAPEASQGGGLAWTEDDDVVEPVAEAAEEKEDAWAVDVTPEAEGAAPGALWEVEEDEAEAEIETEPEGPQTAELEPAALGEPAALEEIAPEEPVVPAPSTPSWEVIEEPPAFESVAETPGLEASGLETIQAPVMSAAAAEAIAKEAAALEDDATMLLKSSPTPPQPLPEEDPEDDPGDETHPGFASSAPDPAPAPVPEPEPPPIPKAGRASEVQPPADVEGPGWAFSKDTVQASDDDEDHKQAKRLARLLVSEIKLYNEEQVEQGQKNNDIYERLREDIDRSRQVYEDRVNERVRSTNDYFYQELVRTLAAGDPQALGI